MHVRRLRSRTEPVLMTLDFSNLHVVVTGGTGALGAAVAELLLDAGATIYIPPPTAGLSAYAPSKAAVANLTLTLSEELAQEKIWANAVLPSTMDTPANRKAMSSADFTKWPKVEQVAATIAFLASPQNQVTRGAL